MKHDLWAKVRELHAYPGHPIQIGLTGKWLWIFGGKESFVVWVTNGGESHSLREPMRGIVIQHDTYEVTYCLSHEKMDVRVVEDIHEHDDILRDVSDHIRTAHDLHHDALVTSGQ